MPYIGVLNSWLKAGVLEGDIYYDTLEGIPQGGVISPTLANFVLAGLEKEILTKCGGRARAGRPGFRTYINRKVHVVRYADDFVVTCHKRFASINIIETIDEFLKPRGLELNKDKTKVTKVTDGFDFLGFNFRTWRNGFILTPTKASIRRLTGKVKSVLDSTGKAPGQIVKELNPILRGWANYYRVSSSTRTFS